MKPSSTLQKVVKTQLLVHNLDLTDMLAEYPARSFEDMCHEITTRTGIKLSARTLRRWFNELEKVAS